MRSEAAALPACRAALYWVAFLPEVKAASTCAAAAAEDEEDPSCSRSTTKGRPPECGKM